MNIGDILIQTYHYSGITNTFYMVVDKTPKSVRLSKLNGKVVTDDGYGYNGTGTEIPEIPENKEEYATQMNKLCKGKKIPIGYDDFYITARIGTDYDGKECAKHKRDTFRLWNGKPVRFMCD